MSAAEHIDELIANLTDWRGSMLANIRRVIREADPETIEEWKWRGTPVWVHDGITCIANAFKDKVKLTFPHGARLADPDKLFNNGFKGREWRSIDLFKGDKINEVSLKRLIHSAVAYNQVQK